MIQTMPIDVHPDVYIYNIGSTVLSKTLCIKIMIASAYTYTYIEDYKYK
mgnify:CR=1 FL=1